MKSSTRMSARRLVQTSSLYLISNLASRAVGFLMLPLYSRFLTPAEYGIVELIELTVQVVALCIGLQSIGGAMIRIFQEAGDSAGRNRVVSTAVIGAVAGNVLLVIAGTALATPISVYILKSPGAETLVRMCLLAMMFSNLAEIGLIHLRLEDRVEHCVVYALVQLAAAVGLNILLIAYLRLGVMGFVVSKLITSSAGCAYLMFRTTRSAGLGWNPAAARRMFIFGGPLVVSSAAFFVIHFGDRWFLSAMRGMDEVGSYALAYRFAFVVTLVVGEPFGKVWNVSLYNYVSQPQWEAQFARVARYLTFSLCLAGLCLSIFAGDIVSRMAAPAYHGAAAVIPLLVAAYVCREMGDFFRNVLYINKRSALVGRIALTAAGVNTAANALVIGRWGMHGAAAATLATWLLYLALCWAAARREHQIPFPVRVFATAITFAVATHVAAAALPDVPAGLRLLIQTLILGQFAGVLWMLGFFPPQERNYIRNKLQGAWDHLAAQRAARLGMGR